VFRELEKAVLAKEELKEFNFFGKQMVSTRQQRHCEDKECQFSLLSSSVWHPLSLSVQKSIFF